MPIENCKPGASDRAESKNSQTKPIRSPSCAAQILATDEHRQGRSVAESIATLDEAQEGAHNPYQRGNG
jgi:hypothetical protein